MGTLLSIIARILFWVLLPIGKLFTWVKHIVRLDYQGYQKQMYNEALSIDQLGNVFYKDLFTFCLITKHSNFAFGNADHTISLVLAVNYYGGTTNIVGFTLVRFIEFCDKNHMAKAIINNKNVEAAQEVIKKFNVKL